MTFSWRPVGTLGLEAGRLRFPDVADVPGVYRFDLGERVYIGEADRLRRRFQHYRTPGPRQMTNLRLNEVMLGLLATSTPIEVCTVTAAELEIDGRREALDLGRKPARLLLENAAPAAQVAGQRVENL